ncbi:MAG: ROK family protein, partial [Rhodobacterales bacterium]
YDINQAAGRKISYINDCRAFGLSEAVFGAGFDYGVVMALNLGTGIGGGIVVDKKLLSGPTRTGGGVWSHCGTCISFAAVWSSDLNLWLWTPWVF